MGVFGISPSIVVPVAILLMFAGWALRIRFELSMIGYVKAARPDLWREHAAIEPTVAAWASQQKAVRGLVRDVRKLPSVPEIAGPVRGLAVARAIYWAGVLLALQFALSTVWLQS
jgi:hypothetical protein